MLNVPFYFKLHNNKNGSKYILKYSTIQYHMCNGSSSKYWTEPVITCVPHYHSWLLWHSPASLMCLYTSSLPAEEYGMSSWATKSIWRGHYNIHQHSRFRSTNCTKNRNTHKKKKKKNTAGKGYRGSGTVACQLILLDYFTKNVLVSKTPDFNEWTDRVSLIVVFVF